MPEIELLVGGRIHGGWEAIRVTRSIESMAGSFELTVSNRWGEPGEVWEILEEDECQVSVDGEVVLTGHVERRRPQIAAEERSLTYYGRDRTAALVDSDVLLDKWTLKGVTIDQLARTLAEPHGIKVSVHPDLILPKPRAQDAFTVSPGDGAFEVLTRASAIAGVLLVSDGKGGLLVTRSGSAFALDDLVEGENILAATGDFDSTQRYARYVVMAQIPGTDEAPGAGARVRAEASDDAVRRRSRVLVVRPSSGVSTDYARRRADWEARVRAARAESVTVDVQGWRQRLGALWPLNALVTARIPFFGVNGTMLIADVENSASAAGPITRLRLVRPDAFTPEPHARVLARGGKFKDVGR